MKKVLLILKGDVIAGHIVETAINISKINRSAILVFFTHAQLQFDKDDDTLTSNKHLVTNMCMAAGIDAVIINENEISLHQILQQETSIQLIIAESPQAANSPGIPNHLATSKCPVYLISADSNKIENIILSYDGSFSSISAIKEYTQLFPEMLRLPTHFVQISTDDNDEFLRQKNIESWLPQPYSNAQYKTVKDGMGTEFFKFIASIPDCLAVIGSRWNRPDNNFVY